MHTVALFPGGSLASQGVRALDEISSRHKSLREQLILQLTGQPF